VSRYEQSQYATQNRKGRGQHALILIGLGLGFHARANPSPDPNTDRCTRQQGCGARL